MSPERANYVKHLACPPQLHCRWHHTVEISSVREGQQYSAEITEAEALGLPYKLLATGTSSRNLSLHFQIQQFLLSLSIIAEMQLKLPSTGRSLRCYSHPLERSSHLTRYRDKCGRRPSKMIAKGLLDSIRSVLSEKKGHSPGTEPNWSVLLSCRIDSAAQAARRI